MDKVFVTKKELNEMIQNQATDRTIEAMLKTLINEQKKAWVEREQWWQKIAKKYNMTTDDKGQLKLRHEVNKLTGELRETRGVNNET